jgi:deoxyribodipyrimidine photo-lyase
MNRFEKHEYAAYTIRPRILKMLPEYLVPSEEPQPRRPWRGKPPDFHVEVTGTDIPKLVASCEIDHSVPPSTCYAGGGTAAEKRLSHFLDRNLKRYARERNQPTRHATSHLSPYLHFGHISSLDVATRARDHAARHYLVAGDFLEELIVRRELAFNHTRFATDPEGFGDLPDWAKKTMQLHASDKRDPVFTAAQLERAQTCDPLWNAAQKELLLRGTIHGYYRMYWGKKIIEWSAGYQEALNIMVHLHDRYALDGRDPNTFTNVLWCFGLHDRPWFERPIFGVIRYMSYAGMQRKTDVQAYIEEIAELERTGCDPVRLNS